MTKQTAQPDRPVQWPGVARPFAGPDAGHMPGEPLDPRAKGATLSPPDRRQVDLVLQSLDTLPTLGPIASRAIRLGSASQQEFEEITKLVESDPALTAKILSICQRVATGVPRSITTVRRAVVMLGWEAVQSAILSVQIYELLRQHPEGEPHREVLGFDALGFWRHSIAVACAADLIATSARHLRVPGNEAFVAGLVHDLGKLALDWVLPRTYDRVLAASQSKRVPLAQLERQVIGLDHHQAGKRLGERWGLPLLLQDAMWLHAQPPAALPEISHRQTIGIVAIADDLANSLHLGWSPGPHDSRPAQQWCAALGIPAESLTQIQGQLHEALAQRCSLLGLGEHTSQQLMIESITQANKHLAHLGTALRQAARAAGEHQRAVATITDYTTSEQSGVGVAEALTRLAEGWAKLTGRAPTAMICQHRAGDDWGVARLDAAVKVHAMQAVPPMHDHLGRTLDLASFAAPRAVADSARLLSWLQKHIDQEQPNQAAPGQTGKDATNQPPPRHAVHTLASPLGPTAVVVFDPDFPLPGGSIEQTVSAFWTWAFVCATQSEGARRIAENLARTARELSETKERLAERQSMARLGEFASGAAHELNNPLTVVAGRAQLLAERLKKSKDPQDLRDAQAIVRAAEDMTNLITQLHLVGRPRIVVRESVNLQTWVLKAVEEARQRTGVFLPVSVQMEGPASASIDHAAAGRALIEMLTNALQASPRECTHVRVTASAGRVSVEVRDDGRGMSEHTRLHAFDPFFSDLPAGRRHGLGLPLAKRLIEAQGGYIELTSTPARGTTARFEVPTESPKQHAKRKAA